MTTKRMRIILGVLVALVFALGLSGVSWGAEFWLRAETFTKTMPSTNEVVTMWGFAQCTDGTYATCNPPSVPGPKLTVPPGDSVLTINLRNNLAGPSVEPVSIVIPGQTAVMTPVKFTDGTGRDRVKSFTTETPADNSTTVAYTWNDLKPGTFLYQSGSHPAVQVQMGLYGAVTRNTAAGQAYSPATTFVSEALLLFSEIDPALHAAVASGNYGQAGTMTSTIEYQPKYFLINGEPYSPAVSPIAAGTANKNILLRLLNAGLTNRVPALAGLTMSVVAEDGNQYPYAKDQYSLLLAPGKTIDALLKAPPAGSYPLFDRRLGLTNNTSPSGGMLRYLQIANEAVPPTGSVVINGDAVTTTVRGVTLTLSATDADNAVTNMRFSWDNVTWFAWEAYATTRNATIPVGANGTKIIYVQFRDAVGNVSTTYSDSIIYDTTAPTGSVAINGGAAATTTRPVTLTINATDALNAVTQMRLSWNGTTWNAWEPYATTRNATIPVGADGTKTIYIQFRDAAGNASTTYSDSILLDTTAPTGSVVINGNAATTNSPAVTLTLSATDTANTVSNMQFSWNGTTWYSWEPYATTRNATIQGGAGVKTIYVRFRDSLGNVSSVYNDSITYTP